MEQEARACRRSPIRCRELIGCVEDDVNVDCAGLLDRGDHVKGSGEQRAGTGRSVCRRAELGRRVPGPARVGEHAPCERDHVGLAGGDDLLRLTRLGDEPDGDRRDARGRPDRRGERHLIPGPDRTIWSGEMPPLDASIQSTPSRRSSSANASVWSMSQPPSTQSVAETRTPSGRSAGQVSRTAATTSSGKRILCSSEPP